MKKRVHVRVKGLVQGVNFRNHTKRKAEHLYVTGWVKNLPDGSVEGCFEGDEGNVDALVDWCRQGPSSALVTEVVETHEVHTNEFQSFEILR